MRRRLAVMMFLQYAILGVWGVTLPTFLMAPPHEGGLSLSGQQVGLLFSTFAIAAILSPFVAGLLADRFFAGQRLFALLHILGTIVLFLFWCESRNAQGQTCQTLIEHTEDGGQEEMRVLLQEIHDAKPVEIADIVESWTHYITNGMKGIPFDRVEWLYGRHRHRDWVIYFMNARLAPKIETITATNAFRDTTWPLERRLFAIMFLYALCYMPSLTLTNAIAFRNLPYVTRQYGHVRVFGTLGWIAGGIYVGMVFPPVSSTPLLLASAMSIVLGLYAYTLPHTPPAHEGKTLGELFGVPAMKMFARRGFRAFVITSFIITLVTAFHNTYLNRYLVDLGVQHAAAWQTAGQVTEILCILAIPWMRSRIGLKRTLFIGLAASVVRFAIYAGGNVPWLLAVGIPLQGVCFGFYFVSALLFIDKHAPRDLRASAQGLLAICTSGVGAFAGNWVAGMAVDGYRTSTGVAWQAVWALPAIGSLAAAMYFAWQFREPAAELEPVLVSV